MPIPISVCRHYSNLNKIVQWKWREIGIVKGILIYYYGQDWLKVSDEDLMLVGGITPNLNDEIDSLDIIQSIFFNFGAYYNRWNNFSKDESRKYYINQLNSILVKGIFNMGLQMTPVIGFLSWKDKDKLLYFIEYTNKTEMYRVIGLDDNNVMDSAILHKKDLMETDRLDFLSVDLPNHSIQLNYLLKRGRLFADLRKKHIG